MYVDIQRSPSLTKRIIYAKFENSTAKTFLFNASSESYFLFTSCTFENDLYSALILQINQHHEALAHATTKNASDGNHYAENLSDGSNASDWEVSEDELSKLRQPLFDGWKRETIVSHITRNGEVQGIVRYYAPGSLVELTDIGQIEQVGSA